MIIDILEGVVIDTSHIFKIDSISRNYCGNGCAHYYDGYNFDICFKHDTGMRFSLLGSNLYKDSTIKWSNNDQDLYNSRMKVIEEKINDLRDRIIYAWVMGIPRDKDQEFNPKNATYKYRFDMYLPRIDLRKDGVSINQMSVNPIGSSMASAGGVGIKGSLGRSTLWS